MTDTSATPFFVAGGTLPPETPSYVERGADRDLYEATRDGEFCWVLTTRQMGKSSLMARTARRLEAHGVRTAMVDLSGIGTTGEAVPADQWYYTLAFTVLRRLGISLDLKAWWRERDQLPPVARFTALFEDVVLADGDAPVVVFFDEIDSTITLDFSDDFFAALRSCYNARATDPRWSRLTFVLLGVATPAELISEPTRTPFNIGRGIDLDDFTLDEARQLVRGLPDARAERVLERIFHWTGGHPYLTQALCQVAAAPEHRAEIEATGPAFIDAHVASTFLAEGAIRREPNLDFVARRLGHEGPHQRQILKIYLRVRRGDEVADQPASAVHAALKLSGVVSRTVAGHLEVRNRIYEEVFTPEWVRAAIPADRRRWYAGAAAAAVLVAAAAVGVNLSNQRAAEAAQFLLRVQAADADAVVATLLEPEWPADEEAVTDALDERGGLADLISAAMAAPASERGSQVHRIVEIARPLLAGPPIGTDEPGQDPAEPTYAGLATALWALGYVASDDIPEGSGPSAADLRAALVEEFTANLGRPRPDVGEDERLNPRISIAGGGFQMGEGSEEHPVTVSAFQIQEHEVTNAEYRRFDPSHDRDAAEEHPVVNVTWFDAMAYAAWLGGSLPTEAQWEFAARGAESRTYPWGDEQPTCDRANFGECGFNLLPVRGDREDGKTPDGVYDMAGNAWEWVGDWFGEYPAVEQTDPAGPPTGGVSARVLRGGSFFGGADALRGAFRLGYVPEFRFEFGGFRVAWSSAGVLGTACASTPTPESRRPALTGRPPRASTVQSSWATRSRRSASRAKKKVPGRAGSSGERAAGDRIRRRHAG